MEKVQIEVKPFTEKCFKKEELCSKFVRKIVVKIHEKYL